MCENDTQMLVAEIDLIAHSPPESGEAAQDGPVRLVFFFDDDAFGVFVSPAALDITSSWMTHTLVHVILLACALCCGDRFHAQ